MGVHQAVWSEPKIEQKAIKVFSITFEITFKDNLLPGHRLVHFLMAVELMLLAK